MSSNDIRPVVGVRKRCVEKSRQGGKMTGLARRVFVVVSALVGCVMPISAAGETWTIQSFQHEDGLVTRELVGFAERLRERTDGRIDIEILPAGKIVPNDETPRAIAAGLLQGHYNTPSYFARLDPAFAILGDTLAAYQDPAARDRWFDEGGGLDLVRELYAKNGLYFIGPIYWPPDWMPAMLPLRNVADLQGVRIRSPGGLVGDLLREAGSEVVQQPTGRVLRALADGDIDATDWGHAAVNHASGLNEVASHHVLMRHSMVLTEMSIGLSTFEGLDDELRPVLEEAVRDFSLHLQDVFARKEKEVLDVIEAKGVTSILWQEAEAEDLRQLVFKVWQSWHSRSDFAAALIDSHRAFLRSTDAN